MSSIPDWSLGDKYLLENAPILVPLIEKYSPCTLQPEPSSRYFEILVRGIISQQLPPDVVNEICQKMQTHFGTITPDKILAVDTKAIQDFGLVEQKAIYLQNFAHMVINGQITFDNFMNMSDSEISKQLLAVKGIGQWTVEMFLLLALCRTDIIPSADHVFVKALKNLLHLPTMPKRGQINKLTETWRPWRSLAVWYLWQLSDEN